MLEEDILTEEIALDEFDNPVQQKTQPKKSRTAAFVEGEEEENDEIPLEEDYNPEDFSGLGGGEDEPNSDY